jgi:hypothetical protein
MLGELVSAFVAVALAPPAFRSTRSPGRDSMASSSKKKTTFAKLARESRLRERRIEKRAKKDARKRASEDQAARVAEPPTAEEQ